MVSPSLPSVRLVIVDTYHEYRNHVLDLSMRPLADYPSRDVYFIKGENRCLTNPR